MDDRGMDCLELLLEADEAIEWFKKEIKAYKKYGLKNEAKQSNDCMPLIKRLKDELTNAQIHADCMEAKAIALEEELEESQRRERAAVEDINSVRMCHTCKHFLREFGMGGIECKIPCATIRHENFEWRGRQDGEGEKE